MQTHLGVELALESRNFRSRPLARQLGASVFAEAVGRTGMELCCEPYCRLPHRPPADWRQPVFGQREPRAKLGELQRERGEFVSSSEPLACSTQWNVSAGSATTGCWGPWRGCQSCKPFPYADVLHWDGDTPLHGMPCNTPHGYP